MNQYSAAWAALNWMTSRRFERLQRLYPNLETAWKNIHAGDLEMIGENKTKVDIFLLQKKKINPEKELEILTKNNIQLVFIQDPEYPEKLKEIAGAPIFIYCKGPVPTQELCLAIVGTRNPSSYGKQACEQLTDQLCQDITIVSGLALGIDSIAHRACLEHKKRTIAILGSGILNIYPQENKNLAEKILEQGGSIISEFSPYLQANTHHFPQRNRIISGLSLGILVIEGKEKSGSLITARYALEHNREVFAVPGNIYSQQSQGTNKLIQKGEAKPISSAEDILEELNIHTEQSYQEVKKQLSFSSPEEEIIFEYLKKDEAKEGRDSSMIIENTQIDQSKIFSTLSIMEMKGMIKDLGMGMWIIQ